jgi:hypothetical protein
VARLTESLEWVFRRGTRHHLGVQRYDIPSPQDRSTFVVKVWAPVNSPLRDESGRVVAALHHAEDITPLHVPDRDDVVGSSTRTSEERAELMASVTALAATVQNIRAAHLRIRDQYEGLHAAFETNREISVAIGLIMARYGQSRPQAWELLRRLSAQTQRKLREVAAEIVATGEPPAARAVLDTETEDTDVERLLEQARRALDAAARSVEADAATAHEDLLAARLLVSSAQLHLSNAGSSAKPKA